MEFRVFIWLTFLIVNKTTTAISDEEENTSSEGSGEKVTKLSCNIIRDYRSRLLKYFCPTIYTPNFMVEYKQSEAVRVICYGRDVNLTSVKINTGPINEFASKECNLVNKFPEIFKQWNIVHAKEWDIEGYSDKEFVLKRSEFKNMNVSEVETVKMQRSNIIEIELDTFYDFVNLKWVSLMSNKIKILPDLFRYSRSVKFIEISNNELETLPDQLTVPSLVDIQLWGNNLTCINQYLFLNASRLKSIELSVNKIEYLPEKLLYSLIDLKTVSFFKNNIKKLPSNFFKMNKNLTDVRLSRLNLSTIPESVFEGLTHLVKLMLQMNVLNNLPEKLFSNLYELKYLYLNDNKLKHLPKSIFNDLKSLEVLDLSNNELSEFPNDIFMNTERLTRLELNENKFRKIESHYFDGLRNLNYLYLESNGLSYVDVAAFNSLKLEVLDLSSNNLTNIDDDIVKHLIFKHSILANKLFLDNNHFERLPNIHSGTNYLYMSSNNIKEIDLSDLINLKQVFLNDNQIEVIDFSYLDRMLAYLPELESRVKVYINNNPIQCGCSVYPLIEFFDWTYHDKRIYNKFYINGELTCQGPSQLAGKDVKKLKSDSFTCNHTQFFSCPKECFCEMHPKYKSLNISCKNQNLECGCENFEFMKSFQTNIRELKLRTSGDDKCASPPKLSGIKLTNINFKNSTCQFDDCPSGCICEFSEEMELFSLNCSNSSLTNIPSIPYTIRKYFERISLAEFIVNLEGNLIEVFTEDISYENVTILNLANNKLIKIDWIPPRIEILNLNNNFITSLNNTIYLLNNSATLRQISLNNNAWDCDCDTIRAIGNNLIEIISEDTISCSNGFFLIELNKDMTCIIHRTIVTNLIILVSLIVLVSVILLIFYFCYEKQVKIWLVDNKFLYFNKYDDTYRGKTNDVFMSYSREDAKFVENCLVPELKNNLECYKLYLQPRDSIADECTTKQIKDSICRSRRTIIILTPNFLNSDWIDVEFKIAQKSANIKQNKLIIILSKNLDLSKVDSKEFQIYLTSKTYIKWDDPLFWKKLRNKLPSSCKSNEKKCERCKRHNIEEGLNTDYNHYVDVLFVP